ncbi:MAG: biotin transporter BioY [Spirochaetota bacterium]
MLVGPTAGSLIGFVPATLLVGTLAERVSRRSVAQMSAVLALGTAVIYLFGAAWLSRFVGWDRTVALGITPFVFGDALKIGIVALAAPTIASFGSRSRSRR